MIRMEVESGIHAGYGMRGLTREAEKKLSTFQLSCLDICFVMYR